MGVRSIRRKGSVETVGVAAGWVAGSPPLLGLFLVLGVASHLAQGTVASPVVPVAWVLAGGVAAVYAERIIAGEPPALEGAVEATLARTLSLIGVGVLVAVPTFLGLLIFVVPGVYVALRSSLAIPACVLDDEDAVSAVQRSWVLAYGNVWKLFGIGLLVYLGATVLLFPVDLVLAAAGAPEATASAVAEALIYAGSALVWSLAATRVYVENRTEADLATATSAGDPGVIGDSPIAARGR